MPLAISDYKCPYCSRTLTTSTNEEADVNLKINCRNNQGSAFRLFAQPGSHLGATFTLPAICSSSGHLNFFANARASYCPAYGFGSCVTFIWESFDYFSRVIAWDTILCLHELAQDMTQAISARPPPCVTSAHLSHSWRISKRHY